MSRTSTFSIKESYNLKVSVLCAGQPILPSLSYPVFIFNPPDILKTHTVYHPPTQIQTHPHHGLPVPQEPGYEVSQFHSQDELGRVVFGFHGPDQSRMESRAIDGTVRGSYSYLDPNGNIVKMQYWDDGSGFHVSGNALPNGQPAYTPEVAAARAQHLRLYQAALQAAHQFGVVSDGSDDGMVDNNGNINHFSDSQFDKGNNGNSLFLEDTDTVSLDNPELFGDFNYNEDDTKDRDKPSISDVEGEVELGEDVGPDEDEEEEEIQEDNDDEEENVEISEKQKFNKKENEEKIKATQGTHFKAPNNYGKDGNEKKTLYKLHNPDQIKGSNIKNAENEDDNENHDEDGQDEDHDLENHEEEENHSDEETHDEDDDHENQEEDHEDEGEEEEHDQNDRMGNIYERQNFKIKDNFKERHDQVKDEGNSMEHSDAETAENRKTSVSQTVVAPAENVDKSPAQNAKNVNEPSVGVQKGEERIQDQLVEKSNTNLYSASFDPSRAFFYHYQHTIPKPIERVDTEAETNPLSLLRTQPLGQPSLQSQLSPYMLPPAIVQPPSDSQHQQSAIVKQAVLPDPGSILHTVPSEVHDAQVSPLQNFAAYNSEKVR